MNLQKSRISSSQPVFLRASGLVALALALGAASIGCTGDTTGTGTTGTGTTGTSANPDATSPSDGDLTHVLGDVAPPGDTPASDAAGGPPDAGARPPGGVDPRTLPFPGWDDATVYFVMTDRFFDGDPSNNHSYGRQSDGKDEVGTFHGGDLAGLTQKLEAHYFQDLGVSAIWITAPVEQIHGWVQGGGGGFKHYSYHGYYALDWTRIDANMGTEDEFGAFVAAAHAQGIRVILDVVMNHPGYATLQDLSELGIEVLKPGWEAATETDIYDFIDFANPNWVQWWGPQWVRAGLPGYSEGAKNPLERQVSFLPDFKTDSTVTVDLPPFFAHKADTAATDLPDTTVRGYLITWLVRWVRDYGVDGFRCDTAKHVDQDSWQALATAAEAAFGEWRAGHPNEAFPESDYPDPQNRFWMTGEVFPHGVKKDAYFDHGFDSVINFDFQKAAPLGLDAAAGIDPVYADYAAQINTDPTFNVLSYLSSHDTALFFAKYAKESLSQQRRAGTLLLMAPGAVQIFYGDENARPLGPNGGDATQGTRSNYQWGQHPDLLAHWRRLGVFRKAHPSVGAGAHTKLSETPYTFSRTLPQDAVVIAIGATGPVDLPTGDAFPDGATVRDAYTGETAIVQAGQVHITAAGPVLLEATSGAPAL